jgi:hypothetical protein
MSYTYAYTYTPTEHVKHLFLSFEALLKKEAQDAYDNNVSSFIIDRKPWMRINYVPPIIIVRKSAFSSTSYHLAEMTDDTYRYVSKSSLSLLKKAEKDEIIHKHQMIDGYSGL